MSNLSCQQRKDLDLYISIARSITGDSTLHSRETTLFQNDHPIYFLPPHVNDLFLNNKEQPLQKNFLLQGKIDSISLRLLLSDPLLHLKNRPKTEVSRLLFDFCEQIRVESITPNHFKGIQLSTQNNFLNWSEHHHQNRFMESKIGSILFTVIQVTYSHLLNIEIPSIISDSIESTRIEIIPLISKQLKKLKASRYKQMEFCKAAKEIATIIDKTIQFELSSEDEKSKLTLTRKLQNIALIVDKNIDKHHLLEQLNTKKYKYKNSNYHIFTEKYDSITKATDLVRKPLLKELRRNLTHEMLSFKINNQKLSKILIKIMKEKERKKKEENLEEGRINSNLLTRIITSPQNKNIFYQIDDEYNPQCSITFLIDCSGSMQKHSHTLSLLMDCLLKTLNIANISCEIIGYTTNNWNGGKAYNLWLKEGQPKNPGRLNELRYIIFKDFSLHWRQARLGIAALRKADLFKESIDGEAIQFATQRLLKESPRKRKIIVNFSDGCPMDTATSITNGHLYLENHLKHMIDNECRRKNIEIYGVGLGVDLSPYYRHNIMLDPNENNIYNICLDLFSMFKKR